MFIKIINIILAVILLVLVLIYAFADFGYFYEDVLLISILMTALILCFPKDKDIFKQPMINDMTSRKEVMATKFMAAMMVNAELNSFSDLDEMAEKSIEAAETLISKLDGTKDEN